MYRKSLPEHPQVPGDLLTMSIKFYHLPQEEVAEQIVAEVEAVEVKGQL